MGTVFLFSDMCATFNGCKSELFMEDPNEQRRGNVLLLYVPSTTIAAKKKVYPHCKGANIYMTNRYFSYYAFISSSFYKQPSYYKSSLLLT